MEAELLAAASALERHVAPHGSHNRKTGSELS